MKFISGGQTGVDRAVLDACLEHNLPCGGWCPKGRLAEDGIIPLNYPLKETDSPNYAERTEKNVLEADASIILAMGPISGGTELSRKLMEKHGKCYIIIDFQSQSIDSGASEILDFIKDKGLQIINFSGPRESECNGIYLTVKSLMAELINHLKN